MNSWFEDSINTYLEVLPEDLGALGYVANRQYLIVERIPLQRERLVELDRLQAPEPEELLELARRAVDERRADIVAPDAFVLVRVAGEDVLAAVGVGEEDARDLRHKMIAPEGFAASPLVLGHLELKPELDGRSERIRGLDDVQERFQGHLQPRPHGEAVSIWVAHDVN